MTEPRRCSFFLSVLKGYFLRRRRKKKKKKALEIFFLLKLAPEIFHLDPILNESEPILYVGSATWIKQHT